MTMEEVFIVTFLIAAIMGISLGFVTYRIFEKDRKEEE
jgi:hypothetical protein